MLRYTLIGAVCLSLIAAGCGPRPAQIDPALARLVPSDTLALVSIKAEALRATPLYRKHLASPLESMQVTEDVSEALAVSDGKEVVIFTKGKKGLTRYDREGNRTAPSAGGGGVPAALLEKLRSISPQNQVFGAGVGGAIPLPEALPQQGVFANFGNLLAGLESWTLAADLRAGVKIEAGGVCKSEDDARRIHDAVRGLLGIARLSTPAGAPELLRVYDAVKVSMDKTTLALSAEIPAEAMDKAMELVQRVPRKGI